MKNKNYKIKALAILTLLASSTSAYAQSNVDLPILGGGNSSDENNKQAIDNIVDSIFLEDETDSQPSKVTNQVEIEDFNIVIEAESEVKEKTKKATKNVEELIKEAEDAIEAAVESATPELPKMPDMPSTADLEGLIVTDEDQLMAADDEKLREAEKIAEAKRVAEQKRLAEEAILAEQKLAEQNKLNEEQRLAEEALIAEQKRLEEEIRVAEEKLAKEQALMEERIAEQARVAEQERLAIEKIEKQAELQRAGEEELITDNASEGAQGVAGAGFEAEKQRLLAEIKRVEIELDKSQMMISGAGGSGVDVASDSRGEIETEITAKAEDSIEAELVSEVDAAEESMRKAIEEQKQRFRMTRDGAVEIEQAVDVSAQAQNQGGDVGNINSVRSYPEVSGVSFKPYYNVTLSPMVEQVARNSQRIAPMVEAPAKVYKRTEAPKNYPKSLTFGAQSDSGLRGVTKTPIYSPIIIEEEIIVRDQPVIPVRDNINPYVDYDFLDEIAELPRKTREIKLSKEKIVINKSDFKDQFYQELQAQDGVAEDNLNEIDLSGIEEDQTIDSVGMIDDKDIQDISTIAPKRVVRRKPENFYLREKELEVKSNRAFKVEVKSKGKADISLLNNAFYASKMGQYSSAIAYYQQFLKAKPKHKKALLGLASTYQMSGNVDAAKKVYLKLIKLDKSNWSAVNNYIVLLTKETPAKAEATLKELWYKNPDMAMIPAHLGNIKFKEGEYNRAVEYYSEAIKAEPSNVKYKYNLANAFEAMGQKQYASKIYVKLLEDAANGKKLPISAAELRDKYYSL